MSRKGRKGRHDRHRVSRRLVGSHLLATIFDRNQKITALAVPAGWHFLASGYLPAGRHREQDG